MNTVQFLHVIFLYLTNLQLLNSQKYFRVGKQRIREAKIQATDYLILLLAGACLGTLAKTSDENFGANGYTYTIIAVCKLDNDYYLF